ncbi:MAG: sugar phosphate isomerase/epimerase, partial [Brevundimonas sp.]
MMMTSRRQMLALAGGTILAGAMGGRARAATPLGLPAGLQLWTVKEELAKDFGGTLRALKAIGYQRVETAGLLGKTPAQFK